MSWLESEVVGGGISVLEETRSEERRVSTVHGCLGGGGVYPLRLIYSPVALAGPGGCVHCRACCFAALAVSLHSRTQWPRLQTTIRCDQRCTHDGGWAFRCSTVADRWTRTDPRRQSKCSVAMGTLRAPDLREMEIPTPYSSRDILGADCAPSIGAPTDPVSPVSQRLSDVAAPWIVDLGPWQSVTAPTSTLLSCHSFQFHFAFSYQNSSTPTCIGAE